MKDGNKVILKTNEKILDKEKYGKLIVEIFYLESALKRFLLKIFKIESNFLKKIQDSFLDEKIKDSINKKTNKKDKYSNKIIDHLSLWETINVLNTLDFSKYNLDRFNKNIKTLFQIKAIRNILCHPNEKLVTDLNIVSKKEGFFNDKNFKTWKSIITTTNKISANYQEATINIEEDLLQNKNL